MAKEKFVSKTTMKIRPYLIFSDRVKILQWNYQNLLKIINLLDKRSENSTWAFTTKFS